MAACGALERSGVSEQQSSCSLLLLRVQPLSLSAAGRVSWSGRSAGTLLVQQSHQRARVDLLLLLLLLYEK